MTVMRYSGALVVSITWRETAHGAKYRCTVRDDTDEKFVCEVGSPAFLTHAIDSSEAFDAAAVAAMAFAYEEAGMEGAAWKDDLSEVHVGRKPEDAWR